MNVKQRIFWDVKYTPYKLHKDATPEQIARHERERKFYTTATDDNIVDYMKTEAKIKGDFTVYDYFQKTTGLFNWNGMIGEQELSLMRRRLKNNKGNVWHGVISLVGEDAKAIDNQDKCINLVKRTFGQFFADAHIDRKNIDLICALHTDTPSHYHLHFLFSEKEPKLRNINGECEYRRKGKIPKVALDNMYVRLALYLDSDKSKNIYLSRDAALKELAKVTSFKGSYVRREDVRNELVALSKDLPKTGRIAYGSKDMEPYRERIDKIVSMLINLDEKARAANKKFYDDVGEREQRIEEMCNDSSCPTRNGSDAKIEHVTLIDNIKFDYKRRQGNIVLNAAMNIKPELFESDKTKKYRRNDLALKKSLAISRDKVNRIFQNLLAIFGSQCELFERDLSNRLQVIENELAEKRKEENRKTEIREEEERRKHWIDDKH